MSQLAWILCDSGGAGLKNKSSRLPSVWNFQTIREEQDGQELVKSLVGVLWCLLLVFLIGQDGQEFVLRGL
jgi:hypothetical protein